MNIFKKIMGSLEMEKKMEELKKICDEYTYKRDRLVKLAQQLFEKRKGYVNTICRIVNKTLNVSMIANNVNLVFLIFFKFVNNYFRFRCKDTKKVKAFTFIRKNF